MWNRQVKIRYWHVCKSTPRPLAHYTHTHTHTHTQRERAVLCSALREWTVTEDREGLADALHEE